MSEIELIKKALESKLPGKDAQFKMAPSTRAIQDQAVNLNGITKNAVLALLFYKSNELHVLLTQRAYYDGPHGGQISFPGGKYEDQSDNNLQDTAIRETYEEIQLSRDYFEVLGKLSTLNIPISKAFIQPYLAFCYDISKCKIDNFEVIDLYEVPVSLLMDPVSIKWKDNGSFKYPYYDYDGKIIWGATAMMLSELAELMSSLYLSK